MHTVMSVATNMTLSNLTASALSDLTLHTHTSKQPLIPQLMSSLISQS